MDYPMKQTVETPVRGLKRIMHMFVT
jgi:hypothetical protein